METKFKPLLKKQAQFDLGLGFHCLLICGHPNININIRIYIAIEIYLHYFAGEYLSYKLLHISFLY